MTVLPTRVKMEDCALMVSTATRALVQQVSVGRIVRQVSLLNLSQHVSTSMSPLSKLSMLMLFSVYKQTHQDGHPDKTDTSI